MDHGSAGLIGLQGCEHMYGDKPRGAGELMQGEGGERGEAEPRCPPSSGCHKGILQAGALTQQTCISHSSRG